MRSIHRAIASCTALCAASSLLLALACGGSESTGPSTGIVLIRASNTGPGLDPDGYVVAYELRFIHPDLGRLLEELASDATPGVVVRW